MLYSAEFFAGKIFVLAEFGTDVLEETWLVIFGLSMCSSDALSIKLKDFTLKATDSTGHCRLLA